MILHGLTGVDYTIVGIVGLSAVISLIRGFVREALSLIVWVLAFWVGFTFSHEAAAYGKNLIHDPTMRFIATFVVLFVLTLFLGGMVNLLLGFLIDRSGLSGTDRLVGMCFGVGRGVLLVGLGLLVLQMTPLVHSESWQRAALIPTFQPLEKWLCGFLPKDIDFDQKYMQALPTTAKASKILLDQKLE